MKTLRILLTVLAVALSSTVASAKYTLFKNGKTSYVIYVGQQASESEKTAAKELQACLKQISGAELPVVDHINRKGGNIFIGYDETAALMSELTISEPKDDDESFVCSGSRGNIFICGGKKRGTMYGVYSFLEKFFNVRWYASDCTVIPSMKQFRFDDFSYSESPAIKYRFVQYCNVEKDPDWCAHNRNNQLWSVSENSHGGIEAYWSAHTFGRFVPAGKYFAAHPEYFSLRGGKRIPDGQLCLSNPEVLKICIDGMKQAIAENPGYWVYSLSQNDNVQPCECDSCKALEEKYGGHSGAMLWFVNQVADAIKPVYPDKNIGTFAYQYTRHAPKNIVPRDNVVIRLCSIECCFAHPIEGCEANLPFVKDLQDWSAIAPKLFIWDYVVNFLQYLAPFPNFEVLAPNIRTFRKYNAVGIQEEAQYQSYGGEFAELKSWVLAKLLWNPDQDVKALVSEFINAYYGPAAQYIQEYFDLTQSLVKDDTVLGIYIDHNNPLYTEDFVKKASGLLSQAQAAAQGDKLVSGRVDLVRLQILYLKVMRDREAARADGSLAEFERIVTTRNIQVNEGHTAAAFLESIGEK